MTLLFFLFIIIEIGLFLGTRYSQQKNYVLISLENITIEMSITTLVIFLIFSFLGAFFLKYTIKKLLFQSLIFFGWLNTFRKKSLCYNEGIMHLFEGNWTKAEKALLQSHSGYHNLKLLYYLIASKAAQEIGNKEKCDYYLQLASQQNNSELVVQITKAKQQIRESEFNHSLNTLLSLKGKYPNNKIILNLLKIIYLKLNLWSPLLELLPVLIKFKLIDLNELELLTQNAQSGILSNIAKEYGKDRLINYWSKLSKKYRSNYDLIFCFANQLIICKADFESYQVVKEAIKNFPDSSIYTLLPKMNLPYDRSVLVFLKNCLKRDANNIALHSAIAQFYLRDQNLHAAHQHFKQCLPIYIR
ncbi:protein hemY [Candidatus Photodesmus katoptron]|uniref:HemY protein n=1 Tax=Candidatus Photodesmus katoptron Akat1 TaxID=1236703 RepID=S3DGD6_9GAMM|nr:heme biosynthesis HemY N-terminal domain-containing protein [Candidatus Photodesmus katoptron]EPE37502.1 hemY protein [Candidatus Photodesmus katoptron Akat1]KEY90331.1 protein hemY [Candidatus Photodesmus katoptron]